MTTLLNRHRVTRLTGFASGQVAVQLIGFASGMVLVRAMEPAQYGYYTLTVSMASIANILTDLGLASAVMAIGGRSTRNALGSLLDDANALHRGLGWLSLGLLAPCFAVLLLRQDAPPWQVAALTALAIASAALNVRAGLALSIGRLLGLVRLQLRLDLAVNVAKLGVLMLAVGVALDATMACAVNLFVAAATWAVWTRHLDRSLDRSSESKRLPRVGHGPALREQLWKQAPNSVYFVISSQLAVWLIGIFGNAERVAEVGALSRLGALFTVIGAVSATLVMPYFARHHGVPALASGFVAVNGFFAAMLMALVALSMAYPEAILWVLGGHYGALQSELVWMVVAATLSAWAGTVYSIGCARGWVIPVGLNMGTGLLATVLAILAVDVATVRGSFMINTATGMVGVLVTVGYFTWQLRRHATAKAVCP